MASTQPRRASAAMESPSNLVRRLSSSLRRPAGERTIAEMLGNGGAAGSSLTHSISVGPSSSAVAPSKPPYSSAPTASTASLKSNHYAYGPGSSMLPPLRGISEEVSLPPSVVVSALPSRAASVSVSGSANNNRSAYAQHKDYVYVPNSRNKGADSGATSQASSAAVSRSASVHASPAKPPVAMVKDIRRANESQEMLSSMVAALTVGSDLTIKASKRAAPEISRSESTLLASQASSSGSLVPTPPVLSHQASSLSIESEITTSSHQMDYPRRTFADRFGPNAMAPPSPTPHIARPRPVVPANPAAQRLPRTPLIIERTLTAQASELSLAGSITSTNAAPSPRLPAPSPRMPHAQSTQSLASLVSYGGRSVIGRSQSPQKPRTWREEAPELILDMLGPAEVRRQEIIWELMNSEEKYARDIRSLLNFHYKPLVELGYLKEPFASQLFAVPHLESMFEIHATLAHRLGERFTERHDRVVTQVSDLLLDVLPLVIGPFVAYNATYIQRRDCLTTLRSSDHLLDVRFKEMQQRSGSLPAEQALELPCVRLTKWKEVVKALLKVTPSNHVDYKMTKEAELKIDQALYYGDHKGGQLALKRAFDTAVAPLKMVALPHPELLECSSDTSRMNLEESVRANGVPRSLDIIAEPFPVWILPKEVEAARSSRVFSNFTKRKRDPEPATLCVLAGAFMLLQHDRVALSGAIETAEVKAGYGLSRSSNAGESVIVQGRGLYSGLASDFRIVLRGEGISARDLREILLATRSRGDGKSKNKELAKIAAECGWRDVAGDEVGWLQEMSLAGQSMASAAVNRDEPKGMRRAFSVRFGGA